MFHPLAVRTGQDVAVVDSGTAVAPQGPQARRIGWLAAVVAWGLVAFVEVFNIPNDFILVFLVPPFELVLWCVGGWLILRVVRRTRRHQLPLTAATLLLLTVACVHFTNWGVVHPSSYYTTHRYAFEAVAAGVREGTVGASEQYYGAPLPWYLRDLSSIGTAAQIGEQDGQPVVFLPQWIGIPDDAAGYVFFNGDPSPELIVDLFGEPAHVRAGIDLGDGWWYLRPGDW
jgi:hypothetical protein